MFQSGTVLSWVQECNSESIKCHSEKGAESVASGKERRQCRQEEGIFCTQIAICSTGFLSWKLAARLGSLFSLKRGIIKTIGISMTNICQGCSGQLDLQVSQFLVPTAHQETCRISHIPHWLWLMTAFWCPCSVGSVSDCPCAFSLSSLLFVPAKFVSKGPAFFWYVFGDFFWLVGCWGFFLFVVCFVCLFVFSGRNQKYVSSRCAALPGLQTACFLLASLVWHLSKTGGLGFAVAVQKNSTALYRVPSVFLTVTAKAYFFFFNSFIHQLEILNSLFNAWEYFLPFCFRL